MRVPIFPLSLFACAFLLLPSEGRSAVTCSATVSDIAFGEVYLRDSLAKQTIGNLAISCQGGVAGEQVQACVFLGQGSGGGTTSARYMRRTDNEPLAYQLYSGGHGGTPWNDVQFAVPLDAQGAGQVSAAIYADILSSGSEVKGGSYSSTYSGSGDVLLRFGVGGCDAGGSSTPAGFQVSASVSPHCTVSAGSMDFGDIGTQLASGASATASLSITCTDQAPYSITLGPGLGPNVSDPQFRRMTNGTHTLEYGLYRDTGNSLPWGWTIGGNDLSSTGTGMMQSFTVHGRVHGGQQPTVGNYSDSVVVTVQY